MTTQIREYNEKLKVFMIQYNGNYKKPEERNRWVIEAFNNGGHNDVNIGLVDVVEWVKKNKPELL